MDKGNVNKSCTESIAVSKQDIYSWRSHNNFHTVYDTEGMFCTYRKWYYFQMQDSEKQMYTGEMSL